MSILISSEVDTSDTCLKPGACLPLYILKCSFGAYLQKILRPCSFYYTTENNFMENIRRYFKDRFKIFLTAEMYLCHSSCLIENKKIYLKIQL